MPVTLIWLFGVSFGTLLGVGVKDNIDYKNCLKNFDQAKCAEMYHIKKEK